MVPTTFKDIWIYGPTQRNVNWKYVSALFWIFVEINTSLMGNLVGLLKDVMVLWSKLFIIARNPAKIPNVGIRNVMKSVPGLPRVKSLVLMVLLPNLDA